VAVRRWFGFRPPRRKRRAAGPGSSGRTTDRGAVEPSRLTAAKGLAEQVDGRSETRCRRGRSDSERGPVQIRKGDHDGREARHDGGSRPPASGLEAGGLGAVVEADASSSPLSALSSPVCGTVRIARRGRRGSQQCPGFIVASRIRARRRTTREARLQIRTGGPTRPGRPPFDSCPARR